MLLKLRWAAGQSQLKDLENDMKLSEFQKIVEKETRIQTNCQKLLAGFPPKLIDNQTTEPIQVLFQNHATIIVQNTESQNTKSDDKDKEKVTDTKHIKKKKDKKKKVKKPKEHKDQNNHKEEDSDYQPSNKVTTESELRRSTRKRKNLNLYVIDEEATKEKTKKHKTDKPEKSEKKTGIHSLNNLQKPKKEKKVQDQDQISIDAILSENNLEIKSKSFDMTNARNLLEEAIIKAAHGQTSAMGKLMETGLAIAQEETLSIERYKASLSKQYRFQSVATQQITNDGFLLPTVKVFFPIEDQKEWKEETFTHLSKIELSAIIKHILKENKDNQEMFQPITLAKVSSRTFWSIIKECGPDIKQALKELVPDYDWSFITRRKRNLSEKKKSMDAQKDLIEESKLQYKIEKEAKKRAKQKDN